MNKGILAVAMFFTLSLTSAFAVPVIDFGTGLLGNQGSMTISGGNVAGSGIGIGALNYFDTGIGTGSATVDGILDFDTGIQGNFIRITGSIPDLNIIDTILLEGTFISHTIVSNTPTLQSFYGTGIDFKSNELLAALEVPLNTPFAFFDFTSTFSDGMLFSVDIGNTAVPEPGSLLLLGTGLAAVGLYTRKRSKR